MQDDEDRKEDKVPEEKVPYVLKDLQEAFTTLEKFSGDTFSGYAFLDKPSPSILRDTIKHVGKVVLSTFSNKALTELEQEQNKARTELTKAIETLKNCYPLLEKYQTGTPEQQKLASLAKKSIERFNESLDKRKATPHWIDMVASFFLDEENPASWLSKNSKIDIPFTATLEYSREASEIAPFAPSLLNLQKEEANLNADAIEPPSQQAGDVFRMKAIRLLREHKIPVKHESLSNFPIRVQHKKEGDQDIISLFQTLIPFPGEVIELKGTIKKNIDSEERPIPLPETFHIATTATQTGFPHPLLHTGWSLADPLIPACPHRQEEMSLFSAVQKRKRELALSLLPKGSKNEVAKELLNRKRTVFCQRKETFIGMHKTLSLAIIEASQEFNGTLGEACAAVELFYSFLIDLPNSYDYLAEVNQAINEIYIRQPYEKLQHLRFYDPELLERVKGRGYQPVYEILDQEAEAEEKKLAEHQHIRRNPLESATIDHILTMGRAMKNALFFIILQEKSEIIGFPPPLLSNFARKVQAAAFMQLSQFCEEIEKGDTTPSNVEKLLEEALSTDIALFKEDSADNLGIFTHLVNEMEAYYNLRYYSRTKK